MKNSWTKFADQLPNEMDTINIRINTTGYEVVYKGFLIKDPFGNSIIQYYSGSGLRTMNARTYRNYEWQYVYNEIK